MANKFNLVVLFAYNGTDYEGLERVKSTESTSVEEVLFRAFPEDTVSLTHISRASITSTGEHAARQVISMKYVGMQVPTVDEINAKLPASIKVFKILQVDKDFSARRTCEARTVEYLIPTYAFSHPPEATHYCNPDEGDISSPESSNLPAGGLFETVKRKGSIDRRKTFIRKVGNKEDEGLSKPSEIDEATNGMTEAPRKNIPKKKSGWKKFVEAWKSIFTPDYKGSDRLKESLNATMKQPTKEEEAFSSTLRRSFSVKKNRTLRNVLDSDIAEWEQAKQFEFDPLSIPAPTEEEIKAIKQYRMSAKQYGHLSASLAIFNGTHNFHNYIPGSVQNDTRCFVHIFNIEASPLEIQEGMEWIRIKIQANAFARDQIRRMMALLILVIRTNTPRSVLGNSFGFSKIDIPECPDGFQILDEPHYNNYNADAKQNGKPLIRFSDVPEAKIFRSNLHKSICEREAVEMRFEKWLRELDNYSFMYTHFLNSRGVITKPQNFPKVHSRHEPTEVDEVLSVAANAGQDVAVAIEP